MSETPAPWSKDFVEHLRTVHFTLVALCLGLIVLATFPSKSEIEAAHNQASEILEVINNWKDDLFEIEAEKVIKKTISDEISAEIATNKFSSPQEIQKERESYIFTITGGGHLKGNFTFKFYDHWFQPKFVHPSWTVQYNIPTELLTKEPLSKDTDFRVKAPTSLKSFQTLWDVLLDKGKILVPRRPNKCIAVGGYIRDPHGSVRDLTSTCEIDLGPPASHNSVDEVWMELASKEGNEGYLKNHIPQEVETGWSYFFSGEAAVVLDGDSVSRGSILLPISKIKEIDFDGHPVLVQRSAKWSEKYRRPFNDAFRELAGVDSAFENTDMDSAERILAVEAKRTGETFDAVGLKIPSEIAIRCGVLLILGVQFYLWVHLHEFGNRVGRDAGYTVAWIGVYFSRPARMLFRLSLLALPFGTVVLLGVRGLGISEHHRWLGWAVLTLSVTSSLALSFLIFLVLPKPLGPNDAKHIRLPKA